MVCVCASDMNMQIESNSSIIQVKGGYKPIAQFFLSRERMNKCLINMKGKVAKISIRGRHLIINHCGSAPWGSRPIQHVLTNSILFRLRITNTINYPWPFIQLSWANIEALPVSKIVVYDVVTFFFMVCIQRDFRLVENMQQQIIKGRRNRGSSGMPTFALKQSFALTYFIFDYSKDNGGPNRVWQAFILN